MMIRSLKNTLVLIGFLLFWIVSAESNTGNITLIKNEPKAGWKFFGGGLLDHGFNKSKSEIMANIDWSQSTWGVGCMHTLSNPVGENKPTAIRVKIRTEKGSATKVYAGVSTKNDANMAISRSDAISVTDTWQTVTFPISNLVKDMPNKSSMRFMDSDWKKIQTIKLLFTKPETGKALRDDIVIRDPELIFDTLDSTDMLGLNPSDRSSKFSKKLDQASADSK